MDTQSQRKGHIAAYMKHLEDICAIEPKTPVSFTKVLYLFYTWNEFT